jgi:hypothetical protein
MVQQFTIMKSDFQEAGGHKPKGGDSSGDMQSAKRGSIAPRPTETNVDIAKIESSVPGRLDVVTTSTATEVLLVHDLYYPG